MTLISNKNIIFNTHCNTTPFFFDIFIIRGEVQARFNSHDHARFKCSLLFPAFIYMVIANIMYI